MLAALIGLTAVFGVFCVVPTRFDGPSTELDWPSHQSAQNAAETLAAHSLVPSTLGMRLLFHLTGAHQRIEAGPHIVPSGLSPWRLTRWLERVDRSPLRITIPEGFTRFDIAERLFNRSVSGRVSFLRATTDPSLLRHLQIPPGPESFDSAEGFLFPSTYSLSLNMSPAEVVSVMVAESRKRHASLFERGRKGMEILAQDLGWTERDVLTLASIIEKEAREDDERPLIASVFLNRLRDPDFRPKRLQADPTSAYGCKALPHLKGCLNFIGRPNPSTNGDKTNPYSTYVREGLPPGPICNPSEASILSVLEPATTRHRYFVAVGGGRHAFHEHLTDHNREVRAQGPAK